MKEYALSHVISLAIPIILIIYGSFFWAGLPTTYWTFLLMVVFVLGYIHYFVGAYYQVKSFSRKSNYRQHIIVFIMLSIASILCALFFIYLEMMIFLSIFVILFFNIHGFLNEKTLLKTQAGIIVSHTLFLPWSLVTTGLLFVAVTHPSFVYNYDLTYPVQAAYRGLTENSTLLTIATSGKFLFWGGIALIVFLLLQKVSSGSSKVSTLIAGSLVVSCIIFFQSPLNYIYLFFFILAYHFLQWSIAYLFLFIRHKQQELPTYVALHVGIICICVISVFSLTSETFTNQSLSYIGSFIFDLRTFITFALFHLGVSLMNEEPFRKVCRLD